MMTAQIRLVQLMRALWIAVALAATAGGSVGTMDLAWSLTFTVKSNCNYILRLPDYAHRRNGFPIAFNPQMLALASSIVPFEKHYLHSEFASLHALRSGACTLTLPPGRTCVLDADTGRVLARRGRHFTFPATTGQTYWFLFQ